LGLSREGNTPLEPHCMSKKQAESNGAWFFGKTEA
jgi:hypothetical protein